MATTNKLFNLKLSIISSFALFSLFSAQSIFAFEETNLQEGATETNAATPITNETDEENGDGDTDTTYSTSSSSGSGSGSGYGSTITLKK